MKTGIFAVAIIFIYKVSKSQGDDKFDCPLECPTNDYKPVCSRGISYANMCVLKQAICKGKTAREIYDDVEACPDFEKTDDASGKSVETIDKNGVLFRSYDDTTKNIHSSTTETPKKSVSTIHQQIIEKSGNNDREDETIEKISSPLCHCGINNSPNNCPQQFPCNSYWPSMPIFFVGNYLKLDDLTAAKNNEKGMAVDNNFLGRLLGVLSGAGIKGSRKLTDDEINDASDHKETSTKRTKKCQRDKRKRNKTKTTSSYSASTPASPT